MSKRRKTSLSGAMLDLWRPPHDAGDPVGCLATTYTFAPGLFDEQCLARFMEIESEPDREDLAFLLERESRLGGVYAAVMVDHTQAGVEHSLRWDVLPVRIRGGKQHAKLSLLVWTRHIRIIVASANFSEPGYRSNYEVAGTVDLKPEEANIEILTKAIGFLRGLLAFVPGASDRPPELVRADEFLGQVTNQAKDWKLVRRRGTVRQDLPCTMPFDKLETARSSLQEAVQACRGSGGSPSEARVASPFFDANDETGRVTASLCKLMARGGRRDICFCVPTLEEVPGAVARLAAPKALLLTPRSYSGHVTVERLPVHDKDKNPRAWHAKMLALKAEASYSALMIGSSNFTCAGMGEGKNRNAEANLLTIVVREAYSRESRQLESIWPEMDRIADPESAEWLGATPDSDEEELAKKPPLPDGFLFATYRAGKTRQIIIRVEPADLPQEWHINACGQEPCELLSSDSWQKAGKQRVLEISWLPAYPPDKLLVHWEGYEAFLPLNVDDSRALPPPVQLEEMSADDMLLILASVDPSAAFRAWAKQRKLFPDTFDPDHDSAAPIDLDPLRRYDLKATFLHRVRRRARVLAQLRANLQRPVWGRQALEWRLSGLVGIKPLAEKLAKEVTQSDVAADEALLTLADFLIVLREVDYRPGDSSLTKADFENVYGPFLIGLAEELYKQINAHRGKYSPDLLKFWERVVEQCRR